MLGLRLKVMLVFLGPRTLLMHVDYSLLPWNGEPGQIGSLEVKMDFPVVPIDVSELHDSRGAGDDEEVFPFLVDKVS